MNTATATTKQVNCKIYYSRIKNCAFVMEERFDGTRIPEKTIVPVYTIYFRQGKYETYKEHEIAQLDGAIRTGSPLITTKNEWIYRDANDEELKVQLAAPVQLNNELRNTGSGGAINSSRTLEVSQNGEGFVDSQQTLVLKDTTAPKAAAVVSGATPMQGVNDADHENAPGLDAWNTASTAEAATDAVLRASIAAAAANAKANSSNPAVAAALAKMSGNQAA